MFPKNKNVEVSKRMWAWSGRIAVTCITLALILYHFLIGGIGILIWEYFR